MSRHIFFFVVLKQEMLAITPLNKSNSRNYSVNFQPKQFSFVLTSLLYNVYFSLILKSYSLCGILIMTALLTYTLNLEICKLKLLHFEQSKWGCTTIIVLYYPQQMSKLNTRCYNLWAIWNTCFFMNCEGET